jgi:GntR family transcriptional regulator/MocR family aminotransferase
MLTYSIQERGETPLYEYLYRQIKGDILAGRLKEGERLPSKRSLARHLSVAVVTVEHAYAQLEAEGYLKAAEKRGYFVDQVAEQPMASAARPPLACRERGEKAWFLDLTANRAIPELFPSALWARLMRQVLSEPGLMEAAPSNGAPGLRRAIAGYLYHFRGMAVEPEQIVVGAGTEYLYTLLIQLLGRKKRFGVEDPGYRKISRIYGANGVDWRPVALDEGGLSLSGLEESGAQVVHISPSHHYPTGRVMPIARRQALLAWASQGEGRYIIEDDYDSEFRFTGRPIPTLQSIDRDGRAVYVNTFSKTIAPSIRIAYMVLPPQLLAPFQEQLGFYASTVPSLEQYTLERFIAGGHFERHLSRARTRYRALRDQVIGAVERSPLGMRTRVLEADAGLHFLLKVELGLGDGELVRRAAEVGIKLSCLSDHLIRPDRRYDGYVVVNYSGAESGKVEEAANRLAQAWGIGQ